MADFPEAWIAEIHERPLCQFLQIQLRHYKQGVASARMRLGPQSLEAEGVISEGALTTLGSWTAQLAILTLVGQGRSIVPLEHRVSLLHAARAGELIAKARVEHLRARLAHCSYRIVDQEGEVIAVGGFLADVLPREPMLRPNERERQEIIPQADDSQWAEDGDASALDIARHPPTQEIQKIQKIEEDEDSLDETVMSSVGSLMQGRPLHAPPHPPTTPNKFPSQASLSLPNTTQLSPSLSSATSPPSPSLSSAASPPSPSLSLAASPPLSTTPATNVGRITSEWSSPFVPKPTASPTSSVGNPNPIARTGAYNAIPEPTQPTPKQPTSKNEPADTERHAAPFQTTPARSPLPTEDTEKYTRPTFPTEDTEKYTRPTFPTEDTEKYTRPPMPSEDTEKYTRSPLPTGDTETYTRPPMPSEDTEKFSQPLSLTHAPTPFDEHQDTGEFDSPTGSHTMLSWRATSSTPEKPDDSAPASVIDADFFDDEPKIPGRR